MPAGSFQRRNRLAHKTAPPVQNAAPPGFAKQATKAEVGGGEVDVTFSTTVRTRYVKRNTQHITTRSGIWSTLLA